MPPLPDQIQQRPGHPLIHRAPEVLAFALYLYKDLVQVPRVTETTLSPLQSRAYSGPNLIHQSRIVS